MLIFSVVIFVFSTLALSPRPPLPRKVGGVMTPSSYGSAAPAEYKKTLRPRTPLRELTVLPQTPCGEGLAVPSPRTPSPALGPSDLAIASPTPTLKLVPTPLGVQGAVQWKWSLLLKKDSLYSVLYTSEWISAPLTLVDTCQVNDIWRRLGSCFHGPPHWTAALFKSTCHSNMLTQQ